MKPTSRRPFKWRSRRVVRLVAGALSLTVLVYAGIPRLLPIVLSWKAPQILFRVETGERLLFMSIDDVPSPNTSLILEVLAKHDVPATFFVTANRIDASDQLADIVRRGHDLGNHLRTTKAASSLSMETFAADFELCADRLHEVSDTWLYRPSSDFGTDDQLDYAQSHGWQSVMGSVFPLDHVIHSPAVLAGLIRWLAIDGGIIILHDGSDRASITAEVLDRVIPTLKADGYRFALLRSAREDH